MVKLFQITDINVKLVFPKLINLLYLPELENSF